MQRLFFLIIEGSVGPKAKVLRPQQMIQDLWLRLRWAKFFAIPTADGFYWQFSQVLPKWRLKCFFHYTGATLETWIMLVLSLKIKTDPLYNEILVKFTCLVGIILGKKFYDMYVIWFFLSYGFGYGLRLKAEVFQGRTFGYGRR